MKRRASVADVLTRLGVEVSRSDGRELWALCPLHPDTDASFQIRDDPNDDRHGWWRCFGCHEGGGLVSLVSEVLGLEVREAIDWIGASQAEAPARLRARLDVIDVGEPIRLPTGVIVGKPVKEWIAPAWRYLAGRGVTPAQISRWGIGYAVSGALRFRVVIPVRDARGRLVSYTGRTFVGDARRYWEPSNDERPLAGAIFGEERWPEDRSKETVVVVEGTFDALATERVRPDLAVAAVCGSDFHPAHAGKLSTFGRVAIVSDPDRAGDAYASELGTALVRYSEVVRVRPPEGADLADMPVRDRFDLLRSV